VLPSQPTYFSSPGLAPMATRTLNGPPAAGLPRSSRRSQKTSWARASFLKGSGAFLPSKPAARCRTAWPLASRIATSTSVAASTAKAIFTRSPAVSALGAFANLTSPSLRTSSGAS
jgi:hypothetical protein